MMKHAFIGVGTLGRRLAGNLLCAGFPLKVHDLEPSAAEELVKNGAIWADTAGIAAEGVNAVITCLPSPTATHAALEGEKAPSKPWSQAEPGSK